jgi:hypothetical protein
MNFPSKNRVVRTRVTNELLTTLINLKIYKNYNKIKCYLVFQTIIFLKLLYEYKVQIFHDFYRPPCSGRDNVAT